MGSNESEESEREQDGHDGQQQEGTRNSLPPLALGERNNPHDGAGQDHKHEDQATAHVVSVSLVTDGA
jgi:hypothetical protein